jgi:hypothetical protein
VEKEAIYPTEGRRRPKIGNRSVPQRAEIENLINTADATTTGAEMEDLIK